MIAAPKLPLRVSNPSTISSESGVDRRVWLCTTQ
jgi:hypothetical protein